MSGWLTFLGSHHDFVAIVPFHFFYARGFDLGIQLAPVKRGVKSAIAEGVGFLRAVFHSRSLQRRTLPRYFSVAARFDFADALEVDNREFFVRSSLINRHGSLQAASHHLDST